MVDIVRKLRLVYRLFQDPRVPVWIKAIPVLAVAYVVFPLDLIADPLLGIGQLDDLAVIMLGLKTFIDLCPTELVEEYLSGTVIIDADYREITEETEMSDALLTDGGTEHVDEDERVG